MTAPDLPEDVATRATLDFVSRWALPPRILEIGSGGGALAARLVAGGFHVVAVEGSEAAAEEARRRGVAVIHGQWPHVSTPRAESVLFSRSLHHMQVQVALAAARAALTQDGVLLIEDFDYFSADAATVAWLRTQMARAAEIGLLLEAHPASAIGLLHASDPLGWWRADHDHDLARWTDIKDALAEQFVVQFYADAPYLYRYLVPLLAPTPDASSWLIDVLGEEQHAAEAGMIRLIGRRAVARLPMRQ
jgi:SAM-dependent methyltransferase